VTSNLPRPRLSLKALLGAILGIASLFFLALAGVPAMILGLYGLRDINASEGLLRGRLLAVAGMVLGALSTLLCVLGIIALVLMTVREKANRTVCQNNLRQLGQTLNQYEDVQGAFPEGTVPHTHLQPEQRLSWLASVLSFTDSDALPKNEVPQSWRELGHKLDPRQAWDVPPNRGAAEQVVRWFRCPSSAVHAAEGQPALTNYVGLAGVGAEAPLLPETSPQAGLFGYNRRTRRSEITNGISFTMMAVETSWELGPWAAGGPSTVRGVVLAQQPLVGVGRPWGGLHPGGLNILMVDGSVPFVENTVSPAVFERRSLIHPRKEETSPEGK
jgi:prepilin-type processing-associated H-X9-DG protein